MLLGNKLDGPAVPCEPVDLGDPSITCELPGCGIVVELDDRAIDCDLVGRRISGKRNNFSLTLPPVGFSVTSDLVAAEVPSELEISSLEVDTEVFSFLCNAVSFDDIALSEDFSFTAALDNSS